MAKKKLKAARASGLSNTNTFPAVQAGPLPKTDVPAFPAVQEGRHPWFYFKDGTIVLKVNYPNVSLVTSVLDFATLADTSYPLQGSPTFSN